MSFSLVLGTILKKLGRKLVRYGEVRHPPWSIALLNKCFRVDVELHTNRGIVYRGPLYAAFKKFGWKKDRLVFRMNWLAERGEIGRGWQYRGGWTFVAIAPSPPHFLENGDVWFTFENGWGKIFLGSREHLPWSGDGASPRIYTYF